MKKNFKVYVVVEDWQCESGESGSNATLFATKEDAKTYLEKAFIDEEQNYTFSEKDDDYFSLYQDGEYVSNHYNAIIVEREVNL